MDRQLEKQLDDLRSMRQASKVLSYRAAVSEQIGTHTLMVLHKKPTLWDRIRGK